MRAIIGFLRATLIGGVIFLLPLGVVLVILGKLFAVSRGIGAALHEKLFPGYASALVPLLIAVALLVLVAFAAGLFARTAAGRRSFAWLEEAILARLPIYSVLRGIVRDMSGVAASFSGQDGARAVMVHFDDHAQLGFVVDKKSPDIVVVFVPGAPSALSGSVVLVEAARVREIDLPAKELLAGMRRLGAGMFEKRRE